MEDELQELRDHFYASAARRTPNSLETERGGPCCKCIPVKAAPTFFRCVSEVLKEVFEYSGNFSAVKFSLVFSEVLSIFGEATRQHLCVRFVGGNPSKTSRKVSSIYSEFADEVQFQQVPGAVAVD